MCYRQHTMSTLAIVIPTKNEARYLPAVLEALKQQTRQPDELVIADAVSTDATADIARSCGAKVVTGGLPARGRNAGAAATTSDLILFLDADVIIRDTGFIAKAVAEFESRQLDIACADARLYGGNMFDNLSFGFYNSYVRMWGARHPHPAGFFILARRSTHDAIGGFDEDVKFAEDHDYGLRARDAGKKFGVLNSVVIGVTTRRQERDGRLRFTLVNALAEPYIMLFGPIKTDIFQYGFGHEEKKT